MSPLAFLLVIIGPVVSMDWGIAAIMTTLAARGTRNRYVFSSIERTLRWPTMVLRITYFVVDVKLHFWGDALFDLFGIAVTIWFMQILGDDDNFWTGKGRKLRRWATSSTSPRTAFAGSAA